MMTKKLIFQIELQRRLTSIVAINVTFTNFSESFKPLGDLN